MLSMMTRIGTLESALNDEQRKLVAATEKYFEKVFSRQPKWRAEESG